MIVSSVMPNLKGQKYENNNKRTYLYSLKNKNYSAFFLNYSSNLKSLNKSFASESIYRSHISFGMSLKRVSLEADSAVERVLLPLVRDCKKQKGLNNVIGVSKLKMETYNKVLIPLCETMRGNNQHELVPNGINFYGPKGTGKTFFAKQLGEHYVEKGGHFEELDFAGDAKTDIEYLEAKFAEAKNRFEDSGKKKYSMFFIDEVEKMFDKNDSMQKPTLNKLIELTHNSKDKGVILITTANYLKRAEPELLSAERTDLRIPMDYVNKYDLPDFFAHYIKKHNLPVEGNIDFSSIIRNNDKTEQLEFNKPKDIEKRLLQKASKYIGSSYKMGKDEIKEIISDINSDFYSEECRQFIIDKAFARKLDRAYNFPRAICEPGAALPDKPLMLPINPMEKIEGWLNYYLSQRYDEGTPFSNIIMPNVACFVGPKNAGKTYAATQWAEYHISSCDGDFVDITSDMTGDLKKDMAFLKKLFTETKIKFEESKQKLKETTGGKKYTLAFIDGTDKLWDFSKESPEDKKAMCELISNSSEKFGTILLTTFDNFASNQFMWGDSFFHQNLENTTASISLARVTKETIGKVVDYCIKKHQLPLTELPDLYSLLDRPEFKTALTIDDVENHLIKMVLDLANNEKN